MISEQVHSVNEISTTVSDVVALSGQKMNFMMISVSIAVLIFIINFFIEAYFDNPKRKIREKQSLKNLRQTAIKKELEGKVTDKAEVKKRYKIEEMCTQAGLDFSYGEYTLLCIFSATILPILITVFLHNISLAIVGAFVGWMIPGQIIAFIRNKRLNKMETQINAFMELYSETYKTLKNPTKALESTLLHFENVNPIEFEIKKTVLDVRLGMPTIDALEQMAFRTGNSYFSRMATYLRVAEDLGKNETRETLMSNALQQSRKNIARRNRQRSKIAGPKNTSLILWFAVPGVALYQIATSDGYVDFMLHSSTGKIGTSVITASLLITLWAINKKISAPIE